MMKRIAVLGGGLSGLTTSYLLSRFYPNSRITLHESSNRLGGWVNSIENRVTGSILDVGPHSGVLGNPTTNASLKLMKDLSLDNKILWLKNNGPASKRLIYVDNRLIQVKLLSLKRQPPFSSSLLYKLVKASFKKNGEKLKTNEDDTSVHNFLSTRFDEEFAEYLGSAIVRGIYAGDSKKISLKAAFPLFSQIDSKPGNFVRNAVKHSLFGYKDPMYSEVDKTLLSIFGNIDKISPPKKCFGFYFADGMQVLTNAIVDEIRNRENVNILLNEKVEETSVKNSRFEVKSNGRSVEYDVLFNCLPIHQYACSLPKNIQEILISDPLSKNLLEMPWVDIAVCGMELTNGPVVLKQRGFGHLIPQIQGPTYLGIVYDSVAFPESDSKNEKASRFTVMMSPHENFMKKVDGQTIINKTLMAEYAFKALYEQLSVDCYEKHRASFIHSDLLFNCIPQYPVGHIKNLEKFRSILLNSCRNLYCAGMSYDGVGLNDVIFSAMRQVSNFLLINK